MREHNCGVPPGYAPTPMRYSSAPVESWTTTLALKGQINLEVWISASCGCDNALFKLSRSFHKAIRYKHLENVRWFAKTGFRDKPRLTRGSVVSRASPRAETGDLTTGSLPRQTIASQRRPGRQCSRPLGADSEHRSSAMNSGNPSIRIIGETRNLPESFTNEALLAGLDRNSTFSYPEASDSRHRSTKLR